MVKKRRSGYKPTRDKIERLKKQCEENHCSDFEKPIPCSKCKISNMHRKIVGLRLEEVV